MRIEKRMCFGRTSCADQVGQAAVWGVEKGCSVVLSSAAWHLWQVVPTCRWHALACAESAACCLRPCATAHFVHALTTLLLQLLGPRRREAC